MELADVLALALADAGAQARIDFPAEYARVDAILAGPRAIATTFCKPLTVPLDQRGWWGRTCPYCSEWFWPPQQRSRFCSHLCGQRFAYWAKKRGRDPGARLEWEVA